VRRQQYTHSRKIIEVSSHRTGQALTRHSRQFRRNHSDVMMPMVDGYATLEQKKKRTVATLKVIFSQQKNKEKDIKRTLR
jgi:CheY-like chemotaxis protein